MIVNIWLPAATKLRQGNMSVILSTGVVWPGEGGLQDHS